MTKVKICGITNLEDATVAVEAGADLLGFIFYEPSPRYVSPDQVREIVAEVKGLGSKEHGVGSKRVEGIRDKEAESESIQCVGVFVNEAVEMVRHILDYCQLDAVQLHGEEAPKEVASFSGRAYKALRPKSAAEAWSLIDAYSKNSDRKGVAQEKSPHLPSLLLDAYHPDLYGGTGRFTDWATAAEIARQHPIMLAGSLTPANVIEAIQAVRPWGVDVSSGVELTKGKKDHQKIRSFLKAVKS